MFYEDQPVDPSRFNAPVSERFTEWLSEHWLALVIGTLCSGALIVWALLLVARVSYGDENHWAPTCISAAVALGLLIISIIEGDDASAPLKATAVEVLT